MSPDISVAEIFERAAALPASERAPFLDAVCAARPDWRPEVEGLLLSLAAGDFAHGAAAFRSEAEFARLAREEAGGRIGHYKLLQQIGEGAFGVVWMADQLEPVQRRVALKIIKLGMDTKEVIARFEQERQALAVMDHPNIARVLDAGTAPTGRPYFVMELVHGIKVTDYCDQANLPTAERLGLFIAVCQAVQHAHQKGIIHRDLKPSNILVTLHDGAPVPKVIDFGVAKATQARLTELTLVTQLQQMIGTPLYMSPEQAEMSGLDIDTRSDIYSLGVLLYELLTGHTPIAQETLARAGLDEVRRVIREVDPPRPSLRVKNLEAAALTTTARQRHIEPGKLPALLRGDLDWIVMKCLEKDRRRRYETANGLALDLQRHLNHELIAARPPTAGYLLGKLLKRRKAAVAAGLAIAASLVLGTAVSVWQAVRATRAEGEQSAERKRAEAALAELRKSAPAYYNAARAHAAEEKLEEALKTIALAISLAPDNADFHLFAAHTLEVQERLAEAAEVYRRVLALRPDDPSAKTNLELCETLRRAEGGSAMLSANSRNVLFNALLAQGRTAEARPLARALNRQVELLEDALRSARSQPGWSKERLTRSAAELELDLSGLVFPDLTPLRGQPITKLNLKNCRASDLAPLQGMPLRWLNCEELPIKDLSPLTGMPLEALCLSLTKLPDLRALAGMPLRLLCMDRVFVADWRGLEGLPLTDLSLVNCGFLNLEPFRGLRLTRLVLRDNRSVNDLTPLAGMPLQELDATNTTVADLSPLRAAPLAELRAAHTLVKSLEPLRGMRLSTLEIASIPARDFASLQGLPLKKLNLHRLLFEDLNLLEGMPLETLVLSNNLVVKDLRPLRRLPLRELDLGGCSRVDDLAPLLGCRALQRLIIPAHFEEVAILRELPALTHLSRVSPQWSDFSRVSTIAEFFARDDGALIRRAQRARMANRVRDHLRSLGTSEDTIASSVQTDSEGLLELDFAASARVTDLGFLQGVSIKTLKIEKTKISDLGPLRSTPLVSLDASQTSIRDLAPLADCPQLTHLDLADTFVSDLRPLQRLKLVELRLEGKTPVPDLRALAACATLEEVTLPRGVAGVEALRGHPRLQRISLPLSGDAQRVSQPVAEFWAEFDRRKNP